MTHALMLKNVSLDWPGVTRMPHVSIHQQHITVYVTGVMLVTEQILARKRKFV